ncbi:MAG: nitroreductase family protein [Candidatus Thorarchaeota archaeon]
MDLPVESWYKAIFQRRSRRKYTGETISDDILRRLQMVIDSFRPYAGARCVRIDSPAESIFTGALGSYGAVRGAPHLVAFIGEMGNPHVQAAVGYLGEGVILEATANDVQTCWVGGFFRKNQIEKEIALHEGEQVLGISPLGYATESKTKIESAMSRVLGSQRRKEISQILLLGSEQPTGKLYRAIEAAKLAPSAANRQPWRFMIDGDSVTLSTKKRNTMGISSRLDCGIAMLHFELGAKYHGLDGSWSLIDDPDNVAEFRIKR